MNIQDVAEFIDLVKNPAKYEALLARLVAEQDRLKAVIETVGVVSEIEQIRKDTLTQEDKAKQVWSDKMYQLDTMRANELKEYETKLSSAIAEQKKYADMQAELKQTLAENKAINKTIKQVEKEVVLKNQELVDKLVELDATKTEYDEKLAKLKAVMV